MYSYHEKNNVIYLLFWRKKFIIFKCNQCISIANRRCMPNCITGLILIIEKNNRIMRDDKSCISSSIVCFVPVIVRFLSEVLFIENIAYLWIKRMAFCNRRSSFLASMSSIWLLPKYIPALDTGGDLSQQWRQPDRAQQFQNINKMYEF